MISSSFDINPIESLCSVLPKLCTYTANKVPLNYNYFDIERIIMELDTNYQQGFMNAHPLPPLALIK